MTAWKYYSFQDTKKTRIDQAYEQYVEKDL